ncbi:MAG: hypothetical protein C0601_12440 [Candidatus Muiribacterium halophilum]|uniref:Anti-sigma factor antagonist n=1 Tax=Muiribacterium halophilum TaxID=2053465 RepID=A0A2N5ZAF9_MUIH1|nr:MAG: hypothetical protein C0601_12440 [Candidatus Muirbacterium halophilum]
MALFTEVKKGEDSIVLKLNDNINSQTIEELEETLKGYVKSGILKIVIDLKDIEFISSQGLGVLVINYKPLAEKEGFIALLNLNDSIKRVMEITRLDKVITVAKSLKEIEL